MRIEFKVLLIILAILTGCDNSKKVNVLFSNVEGLKSNSTVYLDSIVIGKISEMKIKDDGNIVVTLSIGTEFELPKSSKIQYHVDYLGNSYIDIIESKNGLTNYSDTLNGEKLEPDLSEFKEMTPEQLDSLIKNDPNGRLMDTVFKILQIVSKNKKSIDSLNRNGIIVP